LHWFQTYFTVFVDFQATTVITRKLRIGRRHYSNSEVHFMLFKANRFTWKLLNYLLSAMSLFTMHNCCVSFHVQCANKSHNLSLKVDFLFQSFLVITVVTPNLHQTINITSVTARTFLNFFFLSLNPKYFFRVKILKALIHSWFFQIFVLSF